MNDINFTFSVKDDDEQHKEVYAYFGLAVYNAQVLEHQLINMLILMKVANKEKVSIAEIDNLFDRYFLKTMGQLFHELVKTYTLSENEKIELREVLRSRNYIVHDYFKEKIWLIVTQKGRESIIKELISFNNGLKKMDKRLVELATRYYKKVGITEEIINREFEKLKYKAEKCYS